MAGYGAQVGLRAARRAAGRRRGGEERDAHRLVAPSAHQGAARLRGRRRALPAAGLRALRDAAGRARPLGVAGRGVPAPRALGAQPAGRARRTRVCACAAAARCAPRAWSCCASSRPGARSSRASATSRAPASRATRRWSRSRARRRPRSRACAACAPCARASSNAMPARSCSASRARSRRRSEQWPQPPPPQAAAPSTGVVELLQAVLRLRAEEAGIAPSLLATNADLQMLVQRHAARGRGRAADHAGLAQAPLPAAMLLALLEGRASVALDPATGAVRVSQAARGRGLTRTERSRRPWRSCA